MDLQIIWFILIAVLFTGFFVLEGFDYGVGALVPFLSKDDKDRSQIIRTITPVWDGNEVWMITAGGALFASFPHVYSTMFATFYLALFLMLFALILRGVAFEFRGRRESLAWRHFWEGCIVFGSVVPAILWGIAVTDLIGGLPINGDKIYTGGFFDLLSLYSIIGGLAFLFVFLYHGASFLTIRLADTRLVEYARSAGKKIGVLAVIFYVLCMIFTAMDTDLYASVLGTVMLFAAAVVFVLANILLRTGNSKGSFIFSILAIAFTTVGFFAGLFPRLMVSSLDPAYSLTITNASSSPYTLSVMTIVACIFVPIVLIYQIWAYYIFRHRVTQQDANEEY